MHKDYNVEVDLATILKPDDFDENLFKEIHGIIFGEIYSWAGELRTVELSKEGTTFARVVTKSR